MAVQVVDEPSTGSPAAAPADLGRARGRVWSHLLHNPMGVVGMVLLLVVVVVAVFAPLLAPYSPTQVHFATPFQRVGTEGFWLGTDDLGRDIMSRVFYGTRASLEVGLLSVGLAILVGTPLGLVSGYWSWLDAIIARATDLMLAFPFLILAVGLAAINGASLANAAIALGVAQIPTMIRVVRAEALRWKEADFIRSAHALDASSVRIMGQHILPNTASSIIVQATVIMPVAIIGEATLSFLGLGITPPAPSLGIMLSDAQQYIFRSPAAAVIPGVVIVIICLGFNLFGDALRDALDPTTSSKR